MSSSQTNKKSANKKMKKKKSANQLKMKSPQIEI